MVPVATIRENGSLGAGRRRLAAIPLGAPLLPRCLVQRNGRAGHLDTRVPLALGWALVALGYYVGAVLGLELQGAEPPVSSLWPPNAVLLGALLLTDRRRWWLYLTAALPGHFLAHVPTGVPLFLMPVQLTGNIAQAVLGAAAFRYFAGRVDGLRDARKVGAFILAAALIVPALCALVVAALFVELEWSGDLWWTWRTRLQSNALAILTITPLIVIAGRGGASALASLSRRRWIEAGALALGLVAVGSLVFLASDGESHRFMTVEHLLLPLLLWAAVRFQLGGTCLAILGLGAVMTWASLRGAGPFAGHSPAENALAVNLFLVVTAIPLMMLAVLLDEARRATGVLRDAEEVARRMIESTAAIPWRADPQTLAIRYVGPQVVALLGHRLERWYEDDFFISCIHPGDRLLATTASSEAAAGAGEFDFECRFLTSSGETVWLRNVGSCRRRNGTPAEMYGFMIDATSHRRADGEGRRTEALKAAALESATDAIVIVDHEGHIVELNRAAEWVFGYQRAEVLGEPMNEVLIPPSLRDRFRRGLALQLATSRPRVLDRRIETFGMRADGSEFPVELIVTRMDESPPLFAGSIRDLTRRGRVARGGLREHPEPLEALRRREELAHLTQVATLRELTASMAHELNQPLGAILSNADAASMLLDSEPPAVDVVRDILSDIRRDDHRAAGVVRRMVELFHRREVVRVPVPLNRTIEEILHPLAAEAAARGVGLSFVPATSLPDVLGDRAHLQQVVMNLVRNAFDAIASVPETERRAIVRTEARGSGEVEVSVSDVGPGFAPDALPSLFESFFTTKEGGVGLGLSIARTIVEEHQGRILADNNDGRGATFHVVLPAFRGST